MNQWMLLPVQKPYHVHYAVEDKGLDQYGPLVWSGDEGKQWKAINRAPRTTEVAMIDDALSQRI